ncbi:calponin [Vermiconidia calcicola]|uniref:Calponin n=1 Tax=Vermiconidia calcicola TaxID=1690605 RepID=A0ACC3NCQ4_9PEZI|nr:calponin [Vermiconidia calcicola]
MASVSSLDQDMRNLRMSRYTPQAANEVRSWIESTLNERLPPGDLLDGLKDGVALCKLASLVLPPPGIKFKSSPMPFIQMENISHFLKACEMAPLNMPAHDRFLTVDLYESKDPAQVMQCLGAFSRQAHANKPHIFKSAIGPRKTGGTMSPTSTGGAATNGSASWKQPTASFGRSPSPTKASAAMPGSAMRAMSPSLTGGSTGSQTSASGGTKSPSGPVSSWSKRSDEGSSTPAWNIHQYGYMGGASQGNQGISFGARRQITSQAPAVPSLAEKEKVRKEKMAEGERQRQQVEEDEQRRRAEMEAEEERTKVEEERRWEEETRRVREDERRRMDEQKRQWAEQERRWKEEEEARRKEEAHFMSKLPPQKPRVPSSGILRGQSLSQYQKEQAAASALDGTAETPEQKRVRELEKQLEEARERERQYQAEREDRMQRGSRPSTARTDTPSETSWTGDERESLRQQWQSSQEGAPPAKAPAAAQPGAQQRPLPKPELPSRPLAEPQQEEQEELLLPSTPQRVQQSGSASSLPQRMQASTSSSSIPHQFNADSAPNSSPLGTPNRPLPTPDKEFAPYVPATQPQARTDRFLSTNTPPQQPKPRVTSSRETGDTSLEQSSLRDSRIASQSKTKAGGWASKSLLEREMERERERQREWETNQAALKDAPRDGNQGTGEGQSWDVNQYGYIGGDGMNKSSGPGSGIDFGGRRQILGPREMKR